MVKKADDVPEIVQAAEAIERDLQRLEDLSRSVGKMRLDGEKSIGRAGRTLQEALQQQEQLAAGLRVLGEAMMHMQARQQAAVQGIADRAVEIQAQAARVAEHMERFAALGTKAAEATQLLQGLPAPYGAGALADNAPPTDAPAQLMKVETLLGALSDEAKALAASADLADLGEISREASSLRQRLDSARARIGSIAKTHLKPN
jgi:DNA repair exonuclease SbcCD ATPase subunit